MINILRIFFISLDVVVYGLVQSIFQVIIDLANIQLFNDTVIDEFSSRIYIILGLVMLFKIMISFVQMLIDPDKMDDKEQGVGSLLKRVVISLALIVLVPSIFDLARQVQEEIIPVIPKVVLGVESDLTVEDSEAMDSVGRVMSFYTFLAFFNYDNPSCDDGSIIGTGSRLDNDHQFAQPPTIDTIGEAHMHVNDKSPCSTDANQYRYKYNMLISTIVGAYLLWVLVSIAVQIAIRTLKLGICEFVAPIPIASYIDPKTSKQTFDAWVSTCWKTYADLFIRLIIVYFMIFVFQTVLTNDFVSALYGKLGGSGIRATLVTVFIIAGVLQFAKDAPKFISEMLGLKDTGNLMGMFKGEGWKALGATFAAPTGAIVAGAGNIADGVRNKKGFWKTTGSTVAGVTSGLWNGGKAVLSGKSGKEIWNSSTQVPWKRRNMRAADVASGVGSWDRTRVAWKDYFQLSDKLSLAEGREKAISNVRSDISSVKSTIIKRLEEKESSVGFRRGHSKSLDRIGKVIKNDYAAIDASGNVSLKTIADKFDSSGQLKAGEHLTYAEVSQFAKLAAQEKLMSGYQLSDSRFVNDMQKELIVDVANNRAVESDGTTTHRTFNRTGHEDIKGAFAKLYQDINSNVADLGVIAGNSDAASYQRAVNNDMIGLDDELQKIENITRRSVSESKDALARASIQRRRDSKK